MLAAALVAPAFASAEPTTRIIVKRDAGLTAAERRDIRADAGVRLVDTLRLPRTEVVAAPAGDASDALRKLNGDPDVVYAEPDRIRTLFADPVDPLVPYEWALGNHGQYQDQLGLGAHYDADIDGIEAWAQTLPGTPPTPITGAGQTVAVVDSGVDPTVHDLEGDGKVTAFNFAGDANGEPDASHVDAHGTHVAGTIAAKHDTFDVAGVAPDANIVSLRVVNNAQGQIRDSDVAEAFEYAATHNIPIVNASFGGAGSSTTIDTVIAAHLDTLFVFAAGNGGSDHVGDDNDTGPVWPCNSPEDNVICVGASTNSDSRAGFSNYGQNSVDLFAPGVSILSTVPLDNTDFPGEHVLFMDGTSMASPHVAGAAALVRQATNNGSALAVKQLLLDSVDVRQPFVGRSVTGGRLNVGMAVANALNPGGPSDAGDSDGVPDILDVCPSVVGTETAAGCPDADGDTYPDGFDNCAQVSNPTQADLDEDDLGDACDPDIDGDGRLNNPANDNCATVANADQADLDRDGVGDACDPDIDGDGKANGPDNCDRTSNPTQADLDRDGVGDACDPDIDGDGKANAPDNCDRTSNPTQADLDRDGVGDACDPDIDGDGRPNSTDACDREKALTPTGCLPRDPDGDGRFDSADACPLEYAKTANGCPVPAVTELSTRAKKRRGKRSATITVRASRDAIVRVTIQRRRCSHGRCRWVRVTRKTTGTVAGKAKVTARRLKRGKYRAVVVVSSAAGRAAAETQRFRVR